MTSNSLPPQLTYAQAVCLLICKDAEATARLGDLSEPVRADILDSCGLPKDDPRSLEILSNIERKIRRAAIDGYLQFRGRFGNTTIDLIDPGEWHDRRVEERLKWGHAQSPKILCLVDSPGTRSRFENLTICTDQLLRWSASITEDRLPSARSTADTLLKPKPLSAAKLEKEAVEFVAALRKGRLARGGRDQFDKFVRQRNPDRSIPRKVLRDVHRSHVPEQFRRPGR